MEYTKRLISLPKDISDKLGASKNMSHTVVEALTLYWEHKSTVKGLAAKLSRIEQALNRIENTSPTGGFSQVPSLEEQEPLWVIDLKDRYPNIIKWDFPGNRFYDHMQDKWLSIDILE